MNIRVGGKQQLVVDSTDVHPHTHTHTHTLFSHRHTHTYPLTHTHTYTHSGSTKQYYPLFTQGFWCALDKGTALKGSFHRIRQPLVRAFKFAWDNFPGWPRRAAVKQALVSLIFPPLNEPFKRHQGSLRAPLGRDTHRRLDFYRCRCFTLNYDTLVLFFYEHRMSLCNRRLYLVLMPFIACCDVGDVVKCSLYGLNL